MSVQVDGRSVFTKEMTNVFQTEVIECPDCGYEFSSKHELDGEAGVYECSLCNESNLQAENFKLSKVYKDATTLRSIDDWHEDDGDCLWWKTPIEEPPYCGSPLCEDWPGYHTHFTRIILPNSQVFTHSKKGRSVI